MRTLAHRSDADELTRRLRTLQPAAEGRWGLMSAHQMVCHVADAFRMALGDKIVAHSAGLLDRTAVKWVALYLPVPWPKGIRTSPEIDQLCGGGTPPTTFEADLAQAEQLLQATTGRAHDLEGVRHPRFGRMSGGEWLRWGYLHVDHHLRQFGA